MPRFRCLFAVLVIAGCEATGDLVRPAAPEGFVFPRSAPVSADVASRPLEGALRVVEGCLWLEVASTDVVASSAAIWPTGWRMTVGADGRVEVRDAADTVIVREDDTFRFVGRYVSEGADGLDPAVVAEASRCAGGSWLLVDGVALGS